MLRLLGDENGGIHLYGKTSQGKSTAARIARSVWGSNLGSWNATRNGLEALSQQFNDSLLVLDEIGEAEAAEIHKAIYSVFNGTGKGRMTQDLTARARPQWSLTCLSTGEMTIADHASTAGKQTKGGTEVRLINIPVQAHPQWGVFEDLHDADSSKELADKLNANVRQYHGSAGRAFLESILANKTAAIERVKQLKRDFILGNVDPGHVSEVQRAADRFALFAAAGTIATESGITGWRSGEAMEAAARGYETWIADRGTSGSSDDYRAIRQVRKFLQANGSARFVPNQPQSDNVRIMNCAGLREPDGSIFYISPEVFESEVCSGFDKKRVVELLKAGDHLDLGGDGRATKKIRTKTNAVSGSRFYAIKESIFEDEEGSESAHPELGEAVPSRPQPVPEEEAA